MAILEMSGFPLISRILTDNAKIYQLLPVEISKSTLRNASKKCLPNNEIGLGHLNSPSFHTKDQIGRTRGGSYFLISINFS